jgi:ankyrin repeat protein
MVHRFTYIIGRFRWVFCQLETLRQCFPTSIRRILRELPKSLDETYERMLKNINVATRSHAHRLFQCLAVAVRPLRLEELAEVLALDFDEASEGIPKLNADWRREDQEQAVLSTCSSLITVVHVGRSRVVQFSHFSVKEFLTSDRLAAAIGDLSFHHIPLGPAHTILAQACLGVLLRLDDSPAQPSSLELYAAQYWFDHALFENVSSRVKEGMESLFDRDKPHFVRWIRIHDIANDAWALADGQTRPEQVDAAPMYYAALCGFHDVVEKLIRGHPEHVNSRGGACGTALHAAARRNHVKVGQSLLEHGAQVCALGQWGRTPLHIASLHGHLEIEKLLLEHGADVNAKQDYHWTPLHLAAANGHFELIRTLVNHNVDVSAQTNYGLTPLHSASSNGHVDIALFLLDHGADPMACGKDKRTPLHLASYFRKLEVANLLLERGVDVDAEDDEGCTAYQIAVRNGYDEITQLLSGHCAENKT